MQKLSTEELNRKDLNAYRSTPKLPVVLVLDNVRSALNVGSVFRSADAFLVEKIILCGITACPPHREIQKTALGATESVAWEYSSNAIEAVRSLREDGTTVYALEQVKGSIPLHAFPVPKGRVAFVLGHEMQGVQQEVVDACNGSVEIIQEGTKHSLNVSVCAGILCWEMFKKLSHL